MKQKNILFIISDQHRRDSASCYGHDIVKTPAIDKLAATGIRFTNAYSQCPLCGPSRASVLTGTYPHTSENLTHSPEPYEKPLPDIPTLGSVFRDAGYATGLIGKVHIRGESATCDLGFDDRRLRFKTYELDDYIAAVGLDNVSKYISYHQKSNVPCRDHYNPLNEGIKMAEHYMYDALVVNECKDFMKKNRDKRFFLWAGLEKPHPEWFAPEEFHKLYDPEKIPLPKTCKAEQELAPDSMKSRKKEREQYSDDNIKNSMAAYFANVSYLDSKVGELLDYLKELGLEDDTIIVYTSDHGEMLYDHGMLQKHCFYEQAVGVPLIIKIPGMTKPAALSTDAIASLIDLFPTLLEANSIEQPDTLEGESLIPIINGETENDNRSTFSEYYSSRIPERMIRRGDYKYIYSHEDLDQLYNLKTDPLEINNLINQPKLAELKNDLKAQILLNWEMPTFNDDQKKYIYKHNIKGR
jgi:choline-sulfatase